MNDAVPRLTRAEAKKRTLRTLLDSAQRTLMRLGYQGARLDLIAADAGFTKGAVYGHFKSKEELFLTLLSEGLDRQLAEMTGNLEFGRKFPERLDERVSQYVNRQNADYVPILALELQLEARRNQGLAEALRGETDRYHRAMTVILEEYFALVDREPPFPCAQLSSLLMTFSQGHAMARLADPRLKIDFAGAVRLFLAMN